MCCESIGCCAKNYRTNENCRYWTKRGILITLILSGSILMIALLSMYTNIKVPQDEYLVTVNKYTTVVDGPMEQGTYVIKVGDEQYRFKRTYETSTVDYVSCITQDKIDITLFLAIQFQYLKEYIVPGIMKQFSGEQIFDDHVDYKLTSSIISTCSNFTADDFYTRSSIVEGALYANCYATIQQSNLGITLIFLQLKSYQFPSAFHNATTRKLAIAQSEITQLNNRTSQLVVAKTQALVAQQQANMIITNATAIASANIFKANTDADIIKQQWDNKAKGYLQVKTALNLTEDEFLLFLQNDLIGASGNNLFVSMSSSFLAT